LEKSKLIILALVTKNNVLETKYVKQRLIIAESSRVLITGKT